MRIKISDLSRDEKRGFLDATEGKHRPPEVRGDGRRVADAFATGLLSPFLGKSRDEELQARLDYEQGQRLARRGGLSR